MSNWEIKCIDLNNLKLSETKTFKIPYKLFLSQKKLPNECLDTFCGTLEDDLQSEILNYTEEVTGKIIYAKSYPPKRLEDNRSQFEKDKERDWEYIQVVRHMLAAGSPNVTSDYLEFLEIDFQKRYEQSKER